MTSENKARSVDVNGRNYAVPTVPTVMVCLDGSEPGYIEAAIEAGVAPTFQRFMADGTNLLADCVIPSFTNPNNLSIITGRPPAVHGIAGNFFWDGEAEQEVMMNDPKFLRAPTILAGLQDAGAIVATVTAKDKLRLLLSHGLDYTTQRAFAFSAEHADQATLADNGVSNVLAEVGRPLPEVYSADLSEFVFAAGVWLLKTRRPDAMYLSTTDYIQHKAAPGSDIANAFYGMIDGYLDQLDRLGAVIVATADHGMNGKHGADGKPNVIYLQPLLDDYLGQGQARVILPITDPYVGHHGALGSFGTVHVPAGTDIAALVTRLEAIDGIDVVLAKAEACARFELPADRIGDVVVLSNRHTTIGTAPDRHDLSGLHGPLRSHGGLAEQRVPMISNRKIDLPADHRVRNFDIFDVALNRVSG